MLTSCDRKNNAGCKQQIAVPYFQHAHPRKTSSIAPPIEPHPLPRGTSLFPLEYRGATGTTDLASPLPRACAVYTATIER
jgi:hypothetical protein